MLKDRKLIWIVEYVISIAFLAAAMPLIIHPQPGWSDAHGWAYLLFIACSGITLLGSAGSMRRRMKLAERITKLEHTVEDLKRAGNGANSSNTQKHTAKEQFVGSLN
jgi:hypothetical protein